MSDLRKQLDALKSDNRSQRYPGDLVDELLGRREPRTVIFRIGAFATIGGAIAAAIVLWLGHRPVVPTTIQSPTQIAVATQPAEAEPVIPVAAFPAMDAFPQDVPLTPSATQFDIPSMPEIPSFNLDFSDTSDTKEST